MALKKLKKQKTGKTQNKERKEKKENLQAQKTIAYLRVSTNDQDTEKFKLDILKLAHERNLGRVDFVEEKVSSRIPWKQREIYNIIEVLTKGDHLIVPELSRLGRSMLEIMEILSIATQKEINVYIVKGDRKLDDSIESKVLSMAFSLTAEIERDLISSRTKEALKARKAKGVKLGRPKGAGKSRLDPHKEEIVALLKVKAEKKFIAEKFGVTPATLHNWIVKNKIEIVQAEILTQIQASAKKAGLDRMSDEEIDVEIEDYRKSKR